MNAVVKDCPQPETAWREVVQPAPSTRPALRFNDLNPDERELARGMWALAGPDDGCVYFWFGGMLIKQRVAA